MRSPRISSTAVARCVVGIGTATLLMGSAVLPAAAPSDNAQGGSASGRAADPQPPGQAKKDTLRWAAPKDIRIGTAVACGGHHEAQDYPDPFTYDEEYRHLLAEEFNSVSPENQMKWNFIHPERDVYRFAEAGNLRMQDNIWLRELGPGIIADAFRWTHEADPKAKLFLNDHGVAGVNAKSTAYHELVGELLAQGVPVDGFAVQGHLSTRYGFPGDLEANLRRFDDLGLETAITEIDVRMDLADVATPSDAQLEQQADYYRQALQACLNVDDCGSFTIWGFTDKYSWVPVFFEGQGAATVMWEDFQRKPAYYALQSTLAQARPGGQHRP
jgi:GH35 family endo-1,4-beta-xylanase